MTLIDPARTLAELVVAVPRRAMLFEQLQLDYCCGGDRSLAQACAQRNVDVDTVVELLVSLGDAVDDALDEHHDLSRASVADMCDHIVVAHHERMRDELPRLSGQLESVVRVHRIQHPELRDLRRLFERMRRALEEHMAIEEGILFPACRAAESEGIGIDLALLAAHEREHADVGEALVGLRELSGGYAAKRALCGTHRRLLEGLRELERDVHQHVHEENNVLFPRVRAIAVA